MPKFHLHGMARAMKFSAVIASLGCLLIVLFQFNARLAANPDIFLNGNIAPFEWAGDATLLHLYVALAVFAHTMHSTVQGSSMCPLLAMSPVRPEL